ncbi:MAG TPA: acetyl-CoA carboxylase biotin carboxyl carrier protein [Blastocatellia bacterium]|nr:acetyl-CoA carboxylase biotin carboxyl carrier protein [Blastocatellia bacterium]
MNLKELKELIELVSEKGFAEFEMERQGFRLRICRSAQPAAQPPAPAAMPVIVPAPLSVPVDLSAAGAGREKPVEPAQPSAPSQPEAGASAPSEAASDDTQLHTIKSPIVGTFYRAPSPTSESFVKIGDHVEQDSVVCIIEAMKLMNEIQAEVTGEIVKILAENGQPVEYGQPLFAVKAQ